MSISGILGKGNIGKLRVRVELPEEVYDGLPTLVVLHLENPRPLLPAFLIRLTLQGQSALFPLVERRGAESAGITLTFSGRGIHILEPVQLSSIFPINFFVRCRTLPQEQNLTVFPAPRPFLEAEALNPRRARGDFPTSLRGEQGEVGRIGEYRGGEPLKLIHWKLSARHDDLMVKELTATAREPVIIDPARIPGAGLEERLGKAAWLIRELLGQERPVGLKLGRRRFPPALGRVQRLKLLSELAVHGQD